MSGPLVIIGAGEAGARAALALRECGFAGPVTLVGAERHAPYERPPMSKELMLATEAPAPKTIATIERLADAGISFERATTARTIDRGTARVELSDGRILPYEQLLLTTGASPRRLNARGAGGAHSMYLRTHEDALRIHSGFGRGARVVIIGGGFIGLELAAAGRRRGAAVTVVEALPRLLSRGVPADIAAELETRHRREGVSFVFGRGVAAIDESESSASVVLADGKSLDADLVVIGVGAVPEVSLAQAAGLAIDNGIAADHCLRTGDAAIFAAGDCCSFPLDIYGGRRVRLESWRSAQDLGALAARNMLGANEPISVVPWFWSDQYELTLQIAGLPDEGEITVRREWAEGAVLFHLKQDGRLVAASGLGVGNAVARDIRVAEMLIARRSYPDLAALAAPNFKLKALLAA